MLQISHLENEVRAAQAGKKIRECENEKMRKFGKERMRKWGGNFLEHQLCQRS